MPTGGGSSGNTRAVIAIVALTSGAISNWDGSAIPFNSVTYDPHGLWTPASHQFSIVTAGWYSVTTASPGSSGGISAPATAANGTVSIFVEVFGAGDNLHSFADNHAAVGTGDLTFPPVTGYTHLDAGDGVVVVGQGGPGWTVGNGTQFAIELSVAT